MWQTEILSNVYFLIDLSSFQLEASPNVDFNLCGRYNDNNDNESASDLKASGSGYLQKRPRFIKKKKKGGSTFTSTVFLLSCASSKSLMQATD